MLRGRWWSAASSIPGARASRSSCRCPSTTRVPTGIPTGVSASSPNEGYLGECVHYFSRWLVQHLAKGWRWRAWLGTAAELTAWRPAQSASEPSPGSICHSSCAPWRRSRLGITEPEKGGDLRLSPRCGSRHLDLSAGSPSISADALCHVAIHPTALPLLRTTHMALCRGCWR